MSLINTFSDAVEVRLSRTHHCFPLSLAAFLTPKSWSARSQCTVRFSMLSPIRELEAERKTQSVTEEVLVDSAAPTLQR